MPLKTDKKTVQKSVQPMEFGTKMNLPYMLGVYLAVNSVSDVYMLVDGPDCAYFKGEHIFLKHDLFSTLYRTNGNNRILFTGTNAQNASLNREDVTMMMLAKAASAPDAGAILLSNMPMCGITGTDYDRIVSRAGLKKPLAHVPGKSLQRDWLQGYDDTLAAMAGMAGLKKAPRGGKNVAIVGHLMDRNEGDHIGNIRELKRLIRALGLKPVIVWPDGGRFRDLRSAGGTGTIISLPYGRAAAKAISAQTGAKVVETDLPFGISGTCSWLRTVAGHFGLQKRAEAFIKSELDRIVPRVWRMIPFYFMNKRVYLMCDPFQMPGFMDIHQDLGMTTSKILVNGGEQALEKLVSRPEPGVQVVFEPLKEILALDYREAVREGKQPALDLIIGNSEQSLFIRSQTLPAAMMEFGFPSYHHHVLTETPFLGFSGFLPLVERMANILAEFSLIPIRAD
jgi:nitrogenase molybdenum-iron protein alpha/beta subunit